MPRSDEDPHDIQQEAIGFRSGFKTCLIATSDNAGVPDCGYAPFALDADGNLLVFVSQLAQHTRNLLQNPRVGVMFISNEADSRNLFARQRLTLHCDAIHVGRESADYDPALDLLQQAHGNMLGMLRSLPDFQLFQITPIRGRYVRGFGNAWEIEGPTLAVLGLSRG